MHLPITGYGRREVVGISLISVVLAATALWLWPPASGAVLLLWAGLVAFFRDPDRECPEAPGLLLSPADGTVRDVEEVEAPPGVWMDEPAVRVGIFMSVFDVHVNRSPAAGRVRYVHHRRGAFLDARDRRAATENEHNMLGIELPDGRRIMVNQVAGRVARRIVCGVRVGDRLGAGQRFGMVKFGSRLELFVPRRHAYTVMVAPGQKVKAGRDPLFRPAGEEEEAADPTGEADQPPR
ncbi:MAG: phosphatidylserine decarboxylase [Planctomycetota bacterium]